MLISGSIGVIILNKDDNNIILLSDEHSNDIYCNNFSNSKFISDYLFENSKYNTVLLEEIPRDGFSLEELFPNTKHTQQLKNLYLDDKTDIIGIDIRPYLIPFSFETLNINKDNKNTLMKNYIKLVDEFISKNGDLYNNKFKLINKLENSIPEIKNHFQIIKRKYNNFKDKLDLELPIEIYYNNHIELLYDFNEICDSIMELYTILLALNNKTTIIHTGLYHSSNMVSLLVNLYEYRIKYNYGTNKYPPVNEEKITSCIYIPDNFNNFGFKN